VIEYQALTDLLGLNVLGQLSVFLYLWGETLRDARVGVDYELARDSRASERNSRRAAALQSRCCCGCCVLCLTMFDA